MLYSMLGRLFDRYLIYDKNVKSRKMIAKMSVKTNDEEKQLGRGLADEKYQAVEF